MTATGEIKPKNYINIGANAMGALTEVLVEEGDHVKKGSCWRGSRPPGAGRCRIPAGEPALG